MDFVVLAAPEGSSGRLVFEGVFLEKPGIETGRDQFSPRRLFLFSWVGVFFVLSCVNIVYEHV